MKESRFYDILDSRILPAVLLAPVLAGVAWEGAHLHLTGSLDPARHYEYYDRKTQRYQELVNRFWREADLDADHVISIPEQATAYRKLGYEGPFFESKGSVQFPEPTMKDLYRLYSEGEHQDKSRDR